MDNKNQYAGFGRRFLAYWVDFLILFPIGLTVQQMLGVNPFAVFQAENLQQLQQVQQSGAGAIPTLVSLAFSLAFYLIMWVSFDGATPGKKLMAIKIVKGDGSKITYPVAFIRYLGYIVSAFVFLLGYLWVIWDKKKQGWHDKIAGTVVVKTDKQPKTFIALILMIIAILLITGYMGLSMYKGLQLGLKQINKTTGNFSGSSIQKSLDEMNPQAKIHYDRSQVLFKQIRDAQNDRNKVVKINDENIIELKKAIEIQPNNSKIWYDLGSAYTWVSSNGTLEDGLTAYKKAEELDPNNIVYINGVGDMLIQMGKDEDAILQFQKTLRITDASGYANLSLGIAYKNLKIYDSARQHFQKAIEIFSKNNANGSYDSKILEAQKELASLPK